MSNAPIDFSGYRRTVLQKRSDLAQRRLAEADADARVDVESIAKLRAFAEIMGPDSDQGPEARAFADRIERENAAMLAAFRAAVQNAHAELKRLDGPAATKKS